jgi:AraC-like DNA-binding protein
VLHTGHNTSVALVTKEALVILQDCGVNGDSLRKLTASVDTSSDGVLAGELGVHTVPQVALALAAKTGDPELAFRLAELLPRGPMGIVEHLLPSAASLRASFELNQRFAALLSDYQEMALAVDGESAVITPVLPGVGLDPLVEDYSLARIALSIRARLCKKLLPFTRVHFRHPAPDSARAHAELFGTTAVLKFEQPQPALHFPAGLLDETLPGHDPVLNAVLEKYAARLLLDLARVHGLAGRVEQEIASTLHSGRPAITAIAKRFHLSERTLRRRLAEDGTSYVALVDRVRALLAELYMSQDAVSAEYLAARLGFQSDSAFRRAYKRWLGRTFVAAKTPN